MNIKKIVKSAGIHVEEFAELCGVSRVAVYAWLNGRPINPLRKPRIDKLCGALKSAVDAGDLPIERPKIRRVEKADVTKRIRSIVVRHLKLLSKVGG